jgi:DUF1009 family protein
MSANNPIAIIAGGGQLPELLVRDIQAKGQKVVVAGIKHFASAQLSEIADFIDHFYVGNLEGILEYFQQNSADTLLLSGQVDHAEIFDPQHFGPLLKKIIAAGDNRAEALMGRVVAEIESNGFSVADMRQYVSPHLVPEGVFATVVPDDNLLREFDNALSTASKVSELNIGQSILVKYGTVLAVEAMEGTDGMLRRMRDFNAHDSVLIKLPLAKKDPRFDIPVIGARTIENMATIGARLLVVQADNTIVIDPEQTAAAADAAGIAILGKRL